MVARLVVFEEVACVSFLIVAVAIAALGVVKGLVLLVRATFASMSEVIAVAKNVYRPLSLLLLWAMIALTGAVLCMMYGVRAASNSHVLVSIGGVTAAVAVGVVCLYETTCAVANMVDVYYTMKYAPDD